MATGQPWERERIAGRIERYLQDQRRRGYYEARLAAASSFAEDGRAVNLRLTAIQGPVVRVVFAGDAVPENRREELVPMAREGSADEDLLEDSSNRIEEYFRAQGYRDASAPHTRLESDGQLVVTFTVNRGRAVPRRLGGDCRQHGRERRGTCAATARPRWTAVLGRGARRRPDAARGGLSAHRFRVGPSGGDDRDRSRPANDQYVPVAIRIPIDREPADGRELGACRG